MLKAATNHVPLGAVNRVFRNARVRKLRTMREFAEQEIILPTGPHQGERFRVSRQPWTGLWLDELDSGRWRRNNLTGISQAGKTLMGSAIPVMYHLFEVQETVIYAGPTMEIAADKWVQDIQPFIKKSRYRDLMPDTGEGSKGGKPTSIQFKHGPTLRFMTGGGDDKKRSNFTSRVVVITETDGMDHIGGNSEESDKIAQIEARTNSYGDRARIYMECTLSTEEGRTYREFKAGSETQIILQCPHCTKWVTPEREHLIGWQDAEDELQAGELGTLVCPDCGAAWDEQQRHEANHHARLLHRGQSVDDDGNIVGDLPRTRTFAMRFNSSHNLLASMAKVAEEEFRSPRTQDPEAGEKRMRQFYWSIPSEVETVTLTEVDAIAISKRSVDVPRSRIPADTTIVTVGVDLHKRHLDWTGIAWREGGSTPHIFDYGVVDVPWKEHAEEDAIRRALDKFRDEILKIGWPSMTEGVPNLLPSLVLVDSGKWESVAVSFCAKAGVGYLPSKGFGTETVKRKALTGDPGYEAVPQKGGHVLLEINADTWKSNLHRRIQTPKDQPGALTLYHAKPSDHLTFAKHLTAEKAVEEFIPKRGNVTKWVHVSRLNHYLDTTALALVGGHARGMRLQSTVVPKAQQPPPPPPQIPAEPERERDRQHQWIPPRPKNWTRR